MKHSNLLDPGAAALVVIDIQEDFRAPIDEFDRLARNASLAVRGFQILGVPVIVTEQYPKGLGRTAEEIRLVLADDFEFTEKTSFSSCGAAAFADRVDSLGSRQIVLCGLETHICVSQTAHDLMAKGLQVHVLTDCVESRFPADKEAGLRKMLMGGAVPSTVEMALFELMRDSKHPKFREIQDLIK